MYSVQVGVRVRPLTQEESRCGAKVCLTVCKKNSSVILDNSQVAFVRSPLASPKGNTAKWNSRTPRKGQRKVPSLRKYAYDYCYGPDSSQTEIYRQIGLKVIENAFSGYNTSVFAYGQTGSGKTYTMLGKDSEEGLIPRISRELINRMSTCLQVGNKCTMKASYMEIYNETCTDLLTEGKGISNLKVREHPVDGAFVEDLTYKSVHSLCDVQSILQAGQSHRKVAYTKMNAESSRSHAIFTLILTRKTSSGEVVTSKINLIDLAGSERFDASHAKGARLKESANINTSLHQLGRVISALSEANEEMDMATENIENCSPNCSTPRKRKPAKIIPYRDSLLTWLLKPSLGGNSKTTMIVTISPTASSYDETITSLRYASLCGKIKSRVAINVVDTNDENFDRLKKEIESLRKANRRMQLKLSTPILNEFTKATISSVINEIIQEIEHSDTLERQRKTYLIATTLQKHRHRKTLKEHEELSRQNSMLLRKVQEAHIRNDNMKTQLSKYLNQIEALKVLVCTEQKSYENEFAELKRSTDTLKLNLEANIVMERIIGEICEDTIVSCNLSLDASSELVQRKNHEILDLKETLEKACSRIAELQEQKRTIFEKCKAYESDIETIKSENAGLRERTKKVEIAYHASDKMNQKLRLVLKACEHKLRKFSKESKLISQETRACIMERDKEISVLKKRLHQRERSLNSEFHAKDEEIDFRKEREISQKFISGLETIIQTKSREIEVLKSEVAQKDNTIKELYAELVKRRSSEEPQDGYSQNSRKSDKRIEKINALGDSKKIWPMSTLKQENPRDGNYSHISATSDVHTVNQKYIEAQWAYYSEF